MARGTQAGSPGSATSRILTVLAVLVSFAAVVAAVPGMSTWPSVASVASLMVLPAALAASVCAWVAWRLSPSPGAAWFTAATAMIGVQCPLLLLDEDEYARVGLVSSAVVVGLAILLIVRVAERFQLRVAPIPVGVGIGLALLLVSVGWARLPFGEDTILPDTVAVIVLVVMGLLVAVTLARSANLPIGAGRRGVATLLWTWATALEIAGLTTRPGWAVLAITMGLAASVLLAGIGVDLLLLAMSEKAATVRRLERELSTLRDQTRADVEHLHEVKGTIAGIASASALITSGRRLPAQARDRLAEMLTAESARLHRMFDDVPRDTGTASADLDEIIRPLVVAHRVQGQDVVWHPPRAALRAPADPLAEAVNILLHNAAEHAPGAPVWIYTRTGVEDGRPRAELVVVDLGPGVPDDHRDHIFTWGWRGPDSGGRGVGLAIAADIVAAIGGTLRLDTQQNQGTTFVIELPQQSAEAVGAPGRTADEAADADGDAVDAW